MGKINQGRGLRIRADQCIATAPLGRQPMMMVMMMVDIGDDDGDQSVTFLVSKPKCQSQECDIFGFETGFET